MIFLPKQERRLTSLEAKLRILRPAVRSSLTCPSAPFEGDGPGGAVCSVGSPPDVRVAIKGFGRVQVFWPRVLPGLLSTILVDFFVQLVDVQ